MENEDGLTVNSASWSEPDCQKWTVTTFFFLQPTWQHEDVLFIQETLTNLSSTQISLLFCTTQPLNLKFQFMMESSPPPASFDCSITYCRTESWKGFSVSLKDTSPRRHMPTHAWNMITTPAGSWRVNTNTESSSGTQKKQQKKQLFFGEIWLHEAIYGNKTSALMEAIERL